MTVDLSYRVDFAWVEPWSKAFYLYKHLVTWATVHCDRRGLKWQFWSRRLHLVWNWKNGQAWSVSTILLLLKVGRAYLGRTWGLLAQRGHEGHPTNCPELLEHGHNPGVAAPHCVLERRVAPPVFDIQVNLYIWFYIGYCLYIWFCIGYCLYIWFCIGYCLYIRFNVILDIAYIFYCTLYWIFCQCENKPCRSRWGISRRPDGFRRKQDGELSSRRSLPCSCRLLPGRLSQEPSCHPEEKIKAFRNDETEKRTCEAANNSWTSFRLCSS